MKLLMLYNFAQKYRTAIFSLIDKNYDCDWIFGRNTTDIKGMDTACLKKVTFVDNKKVVGPLYCQSGAFAIANKPDYDAIFMLGEPFNLTTWRIMLQNKLSRHKKKIYLWSHGWYGRENLFKKWMKRIYFGMADKTFLYGDYAKKTAVSQGFPEDKLTVIHNSLDHKEQLKQRQLLKPTDIYQQHFGNDYPILVFIGRLTNSKRLDLLINAVIKLREQNQFFNIVLVGDGEARKEIEQSIASNNLQKQVWIYGACYDEKVNAELIFNADICVSPGNIGLTAIHSLMFGTPIITHSNFPYQGPEFEVLIENKTGLFFKQDSIDSLSEAISTWNSNQYDRNEIRQNCYDIIDSYWTPEYQISVIKKYIDGAIN